MDRFKYEDEGNTGSEPYHILDNSGEVLIRDANTEDVQIVDSIAYELAKIKNNCERNFEELLRGLDSINWYGKPKILHPDSEPSELIYDTMAKSGIVDRVTDEAFLVDDFDYLRLFDEQAKALERTTSSSYGYTQPQLIGFLKVKSDDNTVPSEHELREGQPTDRPYRSNFGNMLNSAFMADLNPTKPEIDREILQHSLRGYLYRKEKIPTLNGLAEDESSFSESAYEENFESFSQTKREAGLYKREKRDSGDFEDDFYVEEGGIPQDTFTEEEPGEYEILF